MQSRSALLQGLSTLSLLFIHRESIKIRLGLTLVKSLTTCLCRDDLTANITASLATLDLLSRADITFLAETLPSTSIVLVPRPIGLGNRIISFSVLTLTGTPSIKLPTTFPVTRLSYALARVIKTTPLHPIRALTIRRFVVPSTWPTTVRFTCGAEKSLEKTILILSLL